MTTSFMSWEEITVGCGVKNIWISPRVQSTVFQSSPDTVMLEGRSDNGGISAGGML